MLYRKSSPHPPRLLLRIVATAGAGALLATTACSGKVDGVVSSVPGDSGDDGAVTDGSGPFNDDAPGNACMHGSCAMLPEAGDAHAPVGIVPCGGGPCGSVVMPPDAGDAGGHVGPCGGGPCGVVPLPQDDAGDAQVHGGPCGGGPCGVIIMPHDSGLE